MDSAKYKRKLILWTVITIIILFSLLSLLIYQYTQFWDLKTKQAALDKQLEQLEQDYQMFSAEYEYKTSDDFIEDYARQVLGWNK